MTSKNNLDTLDIEQWKKRLVGKRFAEDNEVLPPSISQDQVVRRRDLPKLHRIIKPKSMVTMDYRPERLNVNVDADNRIVSVRFG
jgi:hypothetical protein